MITQKPKDIGEYALAYEPGTCERIALEESLRIVFFSQDPEEQITRADEIVRTSIGKYKITEWNLEDGCLTVDLQNGSGNTHRAIVYRIPIKNKK